MNFIFCLPGRQHHHIRLFHPRCTVKSSAGIQRRHFPRWWKSCANFSCIQATLSKVCFHDFCGINVVTTNANA
ncbi:hypothetical protein KCP77_20375 [Salmonella enterica subsp. enterica]|nr:hypothetical protein KCP77_20375 [Salmonella enterica subsp. enterica]